MNLTHPGVGGTGLLLDVSKLPKEEAEKFQRSLEQREYSSYTSSLIPLQRSLPDIRLKGCHSLYTDLNLPETSVIIIFYNEHWSVVLRTIHSIMDNTPPHLIKEVILVDDASTDEVLKEPLEEYVSRFRKVQLLRAESRQDSRSFKIVKIHEWGKRKSLLIPTLTFPNLFFTWSSMSEEEWKKRTRETDPVRSPAMVGCVIAVSRSWFKKLGMFDPGLEIWGGENTELSIKTWLCGGGLEIIPCSNVAHMYHPHRPSEESDIRYKRNIARVSNVWLDKYKHYTDNCDGSIADYGDISDRIALRDSLKCHPFEFI
ncbi:putative polypeptide N-acetylgalactosaminyltransferase 9 [Haliotis rubra]|uniref:putative polypeptide N-acetylgalactosaminyltransferase 9 n=1 Tax=Haliotis rubra TaxID=36100 RepID=UPI001EE5C5FD|nr:putative polypeptide N-acetylgalactosaminyltransferase 9 [Haliotis rubra]